MFLDSQQRIPGYKDWLPFQKSCQAVDLPAGPREARFRCMACVAIGHVSLHKPPCQPLRGRGGTSEELMVACKPSLPFKLPVHRSICICEGLGLPEQKGSATKNPPSAGFFKAVQRVPQSECRGYFQLLACSSTISQSARSFLRTRLLGHRCPENSLQQTGSYPVWCGGQE